MIKIPVLKPRAGLAHPNSSPVPKGTAGQREGLAGQPSRLGDFGAELGFEVEADGEINRYPHHPRCPGSD